MKSTVHWQSLAALFLLAAGSFAQTTPSPALLILSKQDRTLAIVDPGTLKAVAHVPVGNDPHEVIASSDGKTAYVSNYGFGAYHTLASVDLVAQKPLPAIDLGALRGPHGLAFRDGKVWFTAEAARSIGSYDPIAGKVDWIMGLGQNRTHMIYVFPDARRIVTTNVNSGTVTILDKYDLKPGGTMPGVPSGAILPPDSDWLLTSIPAGIRNEGFDVSPDLNQAWAVSPVDGKVYVIDLSEKKVMAVIDANAPRANRLKFTPDGKLVLVSAGPELIVIDVASQK
ncbi:MAG: YncE family protein, partial [Terracidiphilus sp.]